MNGEQESQRLCRRCLLQDYDPEAYRTTIEEYLERIGRNDRADEKEYRRRLSVCEACDQLVQGTCMACGCYVELRAAGRHAGCPKKYWQKGKGER